MCVWVWGEANVLVAGDDSSGNVNKPMSTDVNGNPLDPSVYRSMRASPGSNENSQLTTSRVSGSYGSTNHHDTSSGRGGHPDSLGMAKSEDGSSPSGAGSGPGDKRKGKKQRKQSEVTTHAEDCSNYVGDIPNVDQLVSFINSDITEKKLKKIKKDTSGGATSPAAAAVSASPVPANKAVKKGKDRNKTKHSLTTSISDTHDSSLTPASETQQALSLGAESSATPTSSSSLLGSVERNLSPERLSEPSGLDGEEPNSDMGNSSTSEKSGGEEDRASDKPAEPMQQPSQPVFKNHHCVSEKEVANAVSSPVVKPSAEHAKTDSNKNHKNHTLPNTIKVVDAAPKKEPSVEAKDSKDKCKPKVAGKEGGKIHTTDNNSSKKSKTKGPKNDVKSETVHEGTVGISRSHSADAKQRVEAEDEKDAIGNKETNRGGLASPTSLVPKTPNNIDLAMESGEFIFTDVDLPSKEQEFTVVIKKKKRSPPQAPNYGQNNSPSYGYHYSRDTQHQPSTQNFVPYTRNGPRGEFQNRPPPTKTRSCTPPPFSSSVAPPEAVEKSRDLSPSAFPTLPKSKRTAVKVNPLGTDSRRRSLEELTLDTGQQLLGYDSDKESVKSLPAAQGSVRSAYPVSYATMVATPRPSVDSSKAESVCSSMDGGGSGEWQSPMVWKGREGHERRHSIGSSPEDLAKAAGSTLRQRSGSQEMLFRESAKEAADKDAAVSLPGNKGLCQSESAGSFADTASAGSDADSARGGSEAGSDPSDVFVPTVTIVADSKKPSVIVPAGQVHTSVVRTATTTTTANPGTVKPKCAQQALGSRSQPPLSAASANVAATTSQHMDSPSKASHPVVKPVNNGRKTKTSVIFLDKRFAEEPSNLDITFGFDMGDSPSVVVEEGVSSSLVNPSLGGETAVTTQMPPTAVNVSSVMDKSCSSKVSSTRPEVSQPATSKTTSSSVPAPGSDVNNHVTKPAKGPHIAGLNGVVLPQRVEQKPAATGPAPATVHSTVVTTSVTSSASIVLTLTSVSGGAPVPVGPIPAPAVISEAPSSKPPSEKPALEAPPVMAAQPLGALPDGCIALKLGEGLTQGPANGKSRQITFRMHKGLETNGSFNLAEAANYFQREWNKIEKLKEKDPAAVKVYNGE
ncbi:hypothetical protein BaRGS_00002680 [Batillaria attramentaria]|uniref:Uncharacterized protein n=1 Tax=Batillaria attramentaria TaxID=370345 RepID=A0ABD0M2Q3_9CAEN